METPHWLRAPPPPATKKVQTRVPPPEIQGGEMWQRIYNTALVSGHPEPKKMADTILRSRQKFLEIEASRHKTQLTTHKPKPSEIAGPPVTQKARAKAILHDSQRCKAKTLEGRQCGFKATCGLFCSKHKV